MAVCQNLVPLVNIKTGGKWMFIPLKMVLIGIDPYPNQYLRLCIFARRERAHSLDQWDLGDPGMMDRSPGSSSNNNVSKQHSPVVFIIRAVTCEGVWKRNSERETHEERDGKTPIKSINRVFHGKFFYKWLNLSLCLRNEPFDCHLLAMSDRATRLIEHKSTPSSPGEVDWASYPNCVANQIFRTWARVWFAYIGPPPNVDWRRLRYGANRVYPRNYFTMPYFPTILSVEFHHLTPTKWWSI